VGTIDDAPTEVRDPIPSALTALHIAHGYQAWLNSQVDIAQEKALTETHLRATDSKRIRDLTEEVQHLRNRLDGLEAAGPIGLLRWRLGIVRRRLRGRRTVGRLSPRGPNGSAKTS
jgi:hypothetical protein